MPLRRALGLYLLLSLGACTGGEYTVVVRFEPEALADDVERVEVFLVPECGTLGNAGEDPTSSGPRIDVSRGSMAGVFSAVAPGGYGLYARGWSGSCGVVAAGCDPVNLKSGGEGELVVIVRSVSGPGCPAGTTCTAGACVGPDAGPPDAGMTDTGPPCICADCADCDGTGACIPDHGMCGPGTYCDPIDGCTAGEPCPADGSACPGDGNPCTTVSCDDALGICVPDPTMDGTGCTAGGVDGQCRGGDCCVGCWDGGACIGGDDIAACGGGGEVCISCNDSNACTADACSGGACGNTDDDTASCAGGSCHGGACCTGCWDGGACQVGDDDMACGGSGAMCTACDAAACPPTFCTTGACAPIGAGQPTTRSIHFCAIGGDGSLWCWGRNDRGGLGIGSTGGVYSRPTRVGTDSDWAQVGAGLYHSCAVKSGGSLWCWGEDGDGQLGLGGGPDQNTPQRVGTDSNWAQVAGGGSHTCAIKTDGTLWCWGNGEFGRTGLGSTAGTDTPQRVGAATNWTQVDTRSEHTCAVRADGTLWCWGEDDWGELGNGMRGANQMSPRQVGSDTDWSFVQTGGSGAGTARHTCALKRSGALWCWGRGADGQLGIGGTPGAVTMPTQVGADTDWAIVDTGAGHTCAIKTSGTLFCWGDGQNGKLGHGGIGDRGVPTQVGSATDWSTVSAASNATCATRTDDSLWCWGDGNAGELGDGTTGRHLRPERSCL